MKTSAISRSSSAIFAVTGIMADSYPGLSKSEIRGTMNLARRPDLKLMRRMGERL
jgi:hypothetical protein